MMCEGASLDDVRFHIHGLIEGSGWAVIPVEGNTPYRSWAYTVGLVQTFEHPELVVVGLDPLAAGRLLNSIGDAIRDGARLAAEEVILLGREHIHMAQVHACHFAAGTFAAWVDYYGALGPPRPDPQALELVLPGTAPRLNRPFPVFQSPHTRKKGNSPKKRRRR